LVSKFITMLIITGYRIINGHTVTVISKKHKTVNSYSDIETFEKKQSIRYSHKTGQECECLAIYKTVK